jgi:hypothetical protein
MTDTDDTLPEDQEDTSPPRDKLIELPLSTQVDGEYTRAVELRRVMGWEEDLIRDETGGIRGRLRRVSLMLSMCTVRMGFKARTSDTGDNHEKDPEFFLKEYEEMPVPSRTFAYIRLRQLSLGHEFRYAATCPVCKRHIPKIVFPLYHLKVHPVSDEFCGSPTHLLEVDGHRIEWKVPKGKDEPGMVELRQNNPGDLESAELFPYIAKIDGRKPNSLKELKSLSGEVRSAIRGSVDVGGIELIVTNGCPGGHDFTTQLPIFSRSFFLPSAEK